jgi:hypothetical protein
LERIFGNGTPTECPYRVTDDGAYRSFKTEASERALITAVTPVTFERRRRFFAETFLSAVKMGAARGNVAQEVHR